MRNAAARQDTIQQLRHIPTGAHEWRAFERWSQANSMPTYPPTTDPDGAARPGEVPGERMLLRYLHTHVETRSWHVSYARRISGIIARVWIAAGHPDARGERWKRYTAGLARATAAPRTPIAAFTEDEVLAIGRIALDARPLNPPQETAAEVLRMALELGSSQPFADLPELVPHAASRASAAASPPDGEHPRSVREAVTDQWPRALRRLIPGPGHASRDSRRAAFDRWWSSATKSQRELLLRGCADPQLIRRAQDIAYFYTGLTFGGRVAELARLRIGWLQRQPDAIVGTIPGNQHKGGLLALHNGSRPRTLHITIPHAADHPPHCPACRMDDHLNLRALSGAGARDLVFTDSAGGQLSRRYATAIVQRLYASTNPSPEDGRRINTRSIRVTAATLAREKGLSILEIAELGNWRQLSTALLYVRHHDPRVDEDLVLRMTWPTMGDCAQQQPASSGSIQGGDCARL